MATSAWAQDTDGLLQQTPATSGATNVTHEGFETIEKPTDEALAPKRSTELAIAAGGLFAVGNSRAMSYTGSGNFKLRRDQHQLTAAASANYGRAAPDRDSPMQTTVENVQGRLRYDYFLTQQLALFLGTSARRDRFQGLNLRLNIDPGVAYYVIDRDQHQLWFEGGYDFQYDVRNEAAVEAADAAGTPVDDTEARHNARLFTGYENKLNQAVSFTLGLEYLQGLSPFRDDASDDVNWQLNGQAGLSSRVADRFSVNTTVGLRYDNNPLPEIESTDLVTAIQLVYTLL